MNSFISISLSLWGCGCWYAFALLQSQAHFLPYVTSLTHFVFIPPDSSQWYFVFLSLSALLLCILLFPTNFIFEVLLSLLFILASNLNITPIHPSVVVVPAPANPNNTMPQYFTLSLDAMNNEDAKLEVALAKERAQLKRPGLVERISPLLLSSLTLDSIQLSHRIGFGSFGDVYKAVVENQLCAIKRVKEINRVNVSKLLVEVDFLKECHHPNVIQVLGWAESPFVLVLLEYANRGSLRSYLQSDDLSLGWCRVKTKIALDGASAIAFLHNHSILHRDIKADNLLVFEHDDTSLTVKLCDFGCATSFASSSVNDTSSPDIHSASGSVMWHAPEVCLQSSQTTWRSDVWSFGVCLSEIISHAIPYEDLVSGESTFNLLAVSQGRLFPMDTLRPEILKFGLHNPYDRIMSLIKRCCNFQAQERPRMKTVLFELLQLFVEAEEEEQEEPNPQLSISVSYSPSSPPAAASTMKRRSDPTSSTVGSSRKRNHHSTRPVDFSSVSSSSLYNSTNALSTPKLNRNFKSSLYSE